MMFASLPHRKTKTQLPSCTMNVKYPSYWIIFSSRLFGFEVTELLASKKTVPSRYIHTVNPSKSGNIYCNGEHVSKCVPCRFTILYDLHINFLQTYIHIKSSYYSSYLSCTWTDVAAPNANSL